jgi:hypothetical protein
MTSRRNSDETHRKYRGIPEENDVDEPRDSAAAANAGA